VFFSNGQLIPSKVCLANGEVKRVRSYELMNLNTWLPCSCARIELFGAVTCGGSLRKFSGSVVLIIIYLMSSVTAYAASTGKVSSNKGGASSSDIKASNNQIGYQSISTLVNYTETGGKYGVAAGTLDTETGPVPGRAFYFSSMTNGLLGNDYFKGTYDQSIGSTKYTGANLNLPNGPPGAFGSVVSTSGAILTNYNFRYGKGLDFRRASMLTPYVEFGAHRWQRAVNYGETYSNMYYGFGLLNQLVVGNHLVLSLDVLAGHTKGSTITVTSSPPGVPLTSKVTGFSAPLGDSELFKVGVSLDYTLGQRFHVNAGVDYTAFNYGVSAVQPGGLFEPDSQTKNTTFKFGLGWGF
jgi:hypothetical protein